MIPFYFYKYYYYEVPCVFNRIEIIFEYNTMPKRSPYPDITIPEVSLPEFFISRICQFGNDVAIIDNNTGDSITFDEIIAKYRRCAAALYNKGLKKGDVVGICAPSCVEFAIVFLATGACGAILTTCNPDYTEGEITAQFGISNPTMVFAHTNAVERIQKVSKILASMKEIFVIGESEDFTTLNQMIAESREEDFPSSVDIDPKKDVVIMPYSSGTTGLPKCVMHTHYSYIARTLIVGSRFPLIRSSCLYSERPMFHSGGLHTLLWCLSSGCKLITDTCSDLVRMLRAFEKYKVSHTFFVPPILVSLSQSEQLGNYDLSSLKSAICAGSSVPTRMMNILQERLDMKLVQGYGLTEITICSADPLLSPSESAGLILSNTQVKVVDLVSGEELGENGQGEILAKGPQVEELVLLEYLIYPAGFGITNKIFWLMRDPLHVANILNS